MADMVESSSSPAKPTGAKPVVVRVKRKAFQSPLDAFLVCVNDMGLEINGRPLKRALSDFENLSISDSSTRAKEESKSKKVFELHVESLRSNESTIDIVQLFVEPSSAGGSEYKTKSEERRNDFKKENIQDQLLSKARQTQEAVAKTARFEQIWRSRKGNKEAVDDKLHEMCHFYDVVRMMAWKELVGCNSRKTLEDRRLLCSYLPLLREFIPSAAAEIESDLQAYKVGQDDFVYDFYTVNDEMDMTTVDASSRFPLVQVDEEGFCDGPYDSEYGSDDSTTENNPLNDYPDGISEEEEEEDEEVESQASDNESEESVDDGSSESEDVERHGLSEDANLLHEDDVYVANDSKGEDDDLVFDNDGDHDDHGVGSYCKDRWSPQLFHSSVVRAFMTFNPSFSVINTKQDT